MSFLRPIAFAFAFLASPLVAQEPLKPAKLIVAEAQKVGLDRQFFGQVAAKETVDLAFQVGGQVIELPVLEGQRIARGDLIARLEQVPFELRRDQAQLQKDQADRNYERMRKLSGNTVSEVTLQDAETASGVAAIALRDAEWALAHSEIRAPFDGLVSSRSVDLFATVSVGTPVVRMHDLSELRIMVEVPEVLFQRAKTGAEVAITAQFPSGPQEYKLEIVEFDAESSSVGQTFRITLGMAPPLDLNVLPGASVTVTVRALHPDDAILLPPAALVMNPAGETGVMRFSDPGADTGTVTWVPVTVQPAPSGRVQVIAGLTVGDEVVAAGGARLQDGQQVRRFAGFAN